MQPESPKLLWDALHASELIGRFTAGRSFDAYQRDDMLRSAVERQFEIIGEALRQLARVDPETANLIPELPRIIGFRNVLIHGYSSVDDLLVWDVLESKLATLRRTVEALLGGAAHPPGQAD